MREYWITVDTGTTNTRAVLWTEDGQALGIRSTPVGVRDTARDGSNQRLKHGVKECLETLLSEFGITYNQVVRVAASGMITSNVGLVEIPHCTAPVNGEELADAALEVLLEDVCPLPILFIPGVKNSIHPVTDENFESMDIMRGEEVECIALLELYRTGQAYVMILPGSHTKFVVVDEKGRIQGCLTTLSGELLSSIIHDTIIADAVGRRFVEKEEYDRGMVLKGYRAASRCGMGRACFSARILSQFTLLGEKAAANFLYGILLQNDIYAVQHSKAIQVDSSMTALVMGNSAYSCGFVDLLEEERIFKKVIPCKPMGEIPYSARGAYAIARRKEEKSE